MGLGFSFLQPGKKNAYGNKDFADYFPNEENERKIATGSIGQTILGIEWAPGSLSTAHLDHGYNQGMSCVAKVPDI